MHGRRMYNPRRMCIPGQYHAPRPERTILPAPGPLPLLRTLAITLLIVATLAACGGSSGGGGAATPTVPPPEPPPPENTSLVWDQGQWDEENWQ
jgi:hypothetical protein